MFECVHLLAMYLYGTMCTIKYEYSYILKKIPAKLIASIINACICENNNISNILIIKVLKTIQMLSHLDIT